MEILVSNDFTHESNFIGECEKWLFAEIRKPQNTNTSDESIRLVKSETLGLKDQKGHAITIEMLMGNTYIQLSNEALGIYIPSDEIVKRVKYEWFCRLSTKQVLESETIIGKFILTSISHQPQRV